MLNTIRLSSCILFTKLSSCSQNPLLPDQTLYLHRECIRQKMKTAYKFLSFQNASANVLLLFALPLVLKYDVNCAIISSSVLSWNTSEHLMVPTKKLVSVTSSSILTLERVPKSSLRFKDLSSFKQDHAYELFTAWSAKVSGMLATSNNTKLFSEGNIEIKTNKECLNSGLMFSYDNKMWDITLEKPTSQDYNDHMQCTNLTEEFCKAITFDIVDIFELRYCKLFTLNNSTSLAANIVNMSEFIIFVLESPKMRTEKHVIVLKLKDIADLQHRKNSGIQECSRYAVHENIIDSRNSTTQQPYMNYSLNECGLNIWGYLGYAVALLVVVVFAVQSAVFYTRFKRSTNTLSTREIQQFKYGLSKGPNNSSQELLHETSDMDQMISSTPYDSRFELHKKKIKINWEKKLGSGEFGCVYEAVFCSRTPQASASVAVKTSRLSCSKPVLQSLLYEIKILIHLHENMNIVNILGAYTDEIGKGVVYIVTELCETGSLLQYLRDNQPETQYVPINYLQNCTSESQPQLQRVDFEEMVKWSYQICCGMEYLHRKYVIHADLAARNILLTINKDAKITDFGLSKRLYEYKLCLQNSELPIPWRWMAIESLKKLEFSRRSDVWGFGVLLWEIFSFGAVPYPGMVCSVNFVQQLDNGMRLEMPRHAGENIYEIMTTCWNDNPSERPDFTELKHYFREL